MLTLASSSMSSSLRETECLLQVDVSLAVTDLTCLEGSPPAVHNVAYDLSEYSDHSFPVFEDGSTKSPGGQGNLTTNGRQLMLYFGEYLKTLYSKELKVSLFCCSVFTSTQLKGCKSLTKDAQIYSSSQESSIQSAVALAKGLIPRGCNKDGLPPLEVEQPDNCSTSNLFSLQPCTCGHQRCAASSSDMLCQGNCTQYGSVMQQLFTQQMSSISSALGQIESEICSPSSKCDLFQIPVQQADAADTNFLRGPVGTAAYFATLFEAQYMNGWASS